MKLRFIIEWKEKRREDVGKNVFKMRESSEPMYAKITSHFMSTSKKILCAESHCREDRKDL